MKPHDRSSVRPLTRRQFVCGTAAAVSLPLLSTALAGESPQAASSRLAFTAEGKEYRFDTGALGGSLRTQGRSIGLMPVTDAATRTPVTQGFGLFSHYRLLDSGARYGHAAWDWPSTSRLLPDGTVEASWSSDEGHPFDMKAVYRWAAANTFDVTTQVTPRKDLQRFEVFLASYFAGFPTSFVYAQASPETGGKPNLFEAKKSYAVWQMFPRDEEAEKTIEDGRWKRPPNPVDWKIMPRLAGALAVRRDAKSGLAGLLLAPAEDCFAIATPCNDEGHRSVYLSLFGRDLPLGKPATARSRLVIGKNISDEAAIAIYKAYVTTTG